MEGSNRQQLLVVLALGAIGLLAADRMILSPLTKAWQSRSERVVTMRKNLAEGERLLGRESALRERWIEMRTNTLAVEMPIAEKQMLDAVYRWAGQSGVTINSVTPQSKQTEDEYLTMECRADITGDIGTLSRFLYEIEKDGLAAKIDSADFSLRDNSGQQLNLAVQVSGLILATQASAPR